MKYLVELNASDVPANHIQSELQAEFGRAPEPTTDPDILRLDVEEGAAAVLIDYDNNRLWITIEAPNKGSYRATCERIEALLDRSKKQGYIVWSQLEI